MGSLLRRVYGHAKHGVGFGHPKVGGYPVLLRGLSPLVVTLSTPTAAPVITASRLRGGSAGSARGAAGLVAEALATAGEIGAGAAGGLLLLRADSAYYTGTVVSAARRAGARFSITVTMNSAVRRAITGIDDRAWIGICYPQAVFDEETATWISDADVAETPYLAFTGTRHAVWVGLVVRRVRALTPADQPELAPPWRYHAFITDTTAPIVEADLTHRAHAVIEQVFADLIDGPLAHLPSGRFGATSAWLVCAAIAHNLTRAAGTLASRAHGRARGQTLRRQLITVPARVAHRAGGLVLHLPEHWPWDNP